MWPEAKSTHTSTQSNPQEDCVSPSNLRQEIEHIRQEQAALKERTREKLSALKSANSLNIQNRSRHSDWNPIRSDVFSSELSLIKSQSD